MEYRASDRYHNLYTRDDTVGKHSLLLLPLATSSKMSFGSIYNTVGSGSCLASFHLDIVADRTGKDRTVGSLWD
jgi:hypothetical protein